MNYDYELTESVKYRLCNNYDSKLTAAPRFYNYKTTLSSLHISDSYHQVLS